MSDIIVKFKPSGHKEIVTAIKAIQAAEKNLTVAGKKHNVVVANMTAKLKAQNKTWKDLGVSYAIVGKAAKGNRVAMQQLSLAVKKGTKANHGLLSSNRLLDNSFATMRSHMLLFSFAMSLGVRQVAKFTKEAAKLQSMERAFGSLSGGASNAAIAVDRLKEATNGTLSSFDLFQQANNAMILGVTDNSAAMAQMFDMAQRLGNALGKDTKLSVESLITGIGRQSRLMLDNIGIIVKADKAYASYAAKLGKTADTLTQAEKKQAFMSAALLAGREALSGMPDEVLNADQKFQALSASLDDASKEIGEAFLPMAELLAEALTAIADGIDSKKVKEFGAVVTTVLVVAMIAYRKSIMDAVKAQALLGWGVLAISIGLVAQKLIELSGLFNNTSDGFDESAESISLYVQGLKEAGELKIASELKKQTANLTEFNAELKNRNVDLEKTTQLDLDAAAVLGEYNTQQKDRTNFITDSNKAQKEFNSTTEESNKFSAISTATLFENQEQTSKNIEVLKEYNKAFEVGFENIQSYLQAQDNVLALDAKTFDARLSTINQQIKEVELLQKTTEDTEKYAQVLQLLIDKKEQLVKANLKDAKWEDLTTSMKIQSVGRMMTAAGQLVGMNQKNALIAARLDQGSALINTYTAVTDVLKEGTGPMRYVEAAAALAFGLKQVSAIESQLSQMGGGGSGAGGGVYGKFEQGGYVGGNRHSQGGTIIEAERGEFVMSRNAVESIGLETLNQMNQSGGGGNINVSVSGNVLTQDFVEGELAESIKEAVRRGSDFGIG